MNTMWCKHCQQDVPAIASADEKKFRCPRCNEILKSQGRTETDGKFSSEDSPSNAAPDASADDSFLFESWEMDDRLADIGRVLRIDKSTTRRMEKARQRKTLRIDNAHQLPEPNYTSPAMSALLGRKSQPGRDRKNTTLLTLLTWTALWLGTAMLIGGGIMLSWSVFAGRGDLWKIGLPIAIGGQAMLIIGLMLQIDRLWHANRHAVDKLDDQISDLKTTTSMLGTVHGPSSASFYSHLAGGANPQLLLNDLKGQLDLLAIKLSEQHDE